MPSAYTETEITETLQRKEVIKKIRHTLNCYGCLKHLSTTELEEILSKLEVNNE